MKKSENLPRTIDKLHKHCRRLQRLLTQQPPEGLPNGPRRLRRLASALQLTWRHCLPPTAPETGTLLVSYEIPREGCTPVTGQVELPGTTPEMVTDDLLRNLLDLAQTDTPPRAIKVLACEPIFMYELRYLIRHQAGVTNERTLAIHGTDFIHARSCGCQDIEGSALYQLLEDPEVEILSVRLVEP